MSQNKVKPGLYERTLSVFRRIGPGLITVAIDDDPPGVATYSPAGARFGFSSLWTALITYP